MWDIGRRHGKVVRGSAARGPIASSEDARRDCSCFRAAILTARRSVLQRGSPSGSTKKEQTSCVNILAGGTRPVY